MEQQFDEGPMRIDVHFHALGTGTDWGAALRGDAIFRNADDNHHWVTRITTALVERDLERIAPQLDNRREVSSEEYEALVRQLISSSSELDAVILLAMDAFYADGRPDPVKTDLLVPNRYLYGQVQRLNQGLVGKRVLFGASVNPMNPNWEQELAYVIEQTDAVLMKLIPSAQNIELGKVPPAYYAALAEAKLPLLCHVGPEYAFAEGRRRQWLDSFKGLEHPLKHGVTVIAAHCATPVFPLIDRDQLAEFAVFIRDKNQGNPQPVLYADTSALSMASRILITPRVLELIPTQWLVHGSDFPVPADARAYLPYLVPGVSPAEYWQMCRCEHRLDADVLIKRALGFPDSVLSRATEVLRLPDEHRPQGS
jgi:hypothetical protein